MFHELFGGRRINRLTFGISFTWKIEVRDHTKDSNIKFEAQSGACQGRWDLSASLVWYDILSQISYGHVSKLMQFPSMQVDVL